MKRLLVVAAIVVSTTATIAAQTNLNLARAQKTNAVALKNYEWKSRTEIQKDGETKKDQLVQMGYDVEGNLQQTVIATSPELDIPKHGLRGLIAKNKKKDFMRKIEDLKALVRSYSELEPSKMQSFLSSATMMSERDIVRVYGRDVLQPGDSMTIWFDSSSYRQRRVEIRTVMDDKPVKIVSEFQDISRTGPTYMARNEVDYNGASLVIITQNFDYVAIYEKRSATR